MLIELSKKIVYLKILKDKEFYNISIFCFMIMLNKIELKRKLNNLNCIFSCKKLKTIKHKK